VSLNWWASLSRYSNFSNCYLSCFRVGGDGITCIDSKVVGNNPYE
jgi:hypothetical protein